MRSLFIRPPKIPPDGLPLAGLAGCCAPEVPPEPPIVLAFGCLGTSAARAGVYLPKKLPSSELLGALACPVEVKGEAFSTAEPLWDVAVPALSLSEGLPKRLLEGPRMPEVVLDLGLKMLREACPELCGRVSPVDGRACMLPAGWLILGTVVLMEGLGAGATERVVAVGGWAVFAGEVALLGVLLTLGDWLGVAEAGRLAAGWLVRLPLSALLFLLCAQVGVIKTVKAKASAMPTCENFEFRISILEFVSLYLPVNMGGLLNYL